MATNTSTTAKDATVETEEPTTDETTGTVTELKERTESRVSRIKSHPMTRRCVRNTVRLGVVGLGYTICDEGLNRTSFKEQEPRVAVLWNGANA